MPRPIELAAVFLGGGTGALVRYAATLILPKPTVLGLPIATLAVNTLGSLLAGVALHLFLQRTTTEPGTLGTAQHTVPLAKLLLVTGFLGGFTTMSAFAAESITLLRDQRPAAMLAYAALMTALCLAAALLGVALARAASPA